VGPDGFAPSHMGVRPECRQLGGHGPAESSRGKGIRSRRRRPASRRRPRSKSTPVRVAWSVGSKEYEPADMRGSSADLVPNPGTATQHESLDEELG